jgi:hypothetical protein
MFIRSSKPYKVKLPSAGVFLIPRGWLVEPIGPLRAVVPHLSSLRPQNLEVGVLLPVKCGINGK